MLTINYLKITGKYYTGIESSQLSILINFVLSIDFTFSVKINLPWLLELQAEAIGSRHSLFVGLLFWCVIIINL